tara:strand:- start:226 stop:558 length:333 start_codon:yes stop_codon:yes gene_type:complete
MKITKKELKELILQEFLNTTVPVRDQPNKVDIQFRTGPFTSLVSTAWDTLNLLEESIRNSGDLKTQDIEGLKNNELPRLMLKIGMIEGAIKAKLEGKLNQDRKPYDSSYE